MKVVLFGVLSAAAFAGAVGCKRDVPAEEKPPPPVVEAKRQELPVDLVPAPQAGDVQEIVRRELARAKNDGHRLLVYVGAAWCEPCQRFHQAARTGQVDTLFPGLRLLEFDLDRDRERLEASGYRSKMIPLFAVPREDGTSSGQQIEGSIKGPGAIEQITPRLKELLGK
jgi:hypothetical protein